MGAAFAAFTIEEAVFTYNRLPTIFIDFCTSLVFVYVIVFYSSYQRIKTNKLSFLKSKKTQSLLKEQVRIFQHLPDGAVIYRKLISQIEDGETEVRVMPGERVSTQIKYTNLTF